MIINGIELDHPELKMGKLYSLRENPTFHWGYEFGDNKLYTTYIGFTDPGLVLFDFTFKSNAILFLYDYESWVVKNAGCVKMLFLHNTRTITYQYRKDSSERKPMMDYCKDFFNDWKVVV